MCVGKGMLNGKISQRSISERERSKIKIKDVVRKKERESYVTIYQTDKWTTDEHTNEI